MDKFQLTEGSRNASKYNFWLFYQMKQQELATQVTRRQILANSFVSCPQEENDLKNVSTVYFRTILLSYSPALQKW